MDPAMADHLKKLADESYQKLRSVQLPDLTNDSTLRTWDATYKKNHVTNESLSVAAAEIYLNKEDSEFRNSIERFISNCFFSVRQWEHDLCDEIEEETATSETVEQHAENVSKKGNLTCSEQKVLANTANSLQSKKTVRFDIVFTDTRKINQIKNCNSTQRLYPNKLRELARDDAEC